MNEIFNFKRFGQYISADIKDCASRFGLNLILGCFAGVFAYIIVGMTGILAGGGWQSFGEAGRTVMFGFITLILCITMPSKCYGRITDKGEGSSFLMIPASSVEKTISMILICGIIIPVVFMAIYLGADALICFLDADCGSNLFSLNIMDELNLALNEKYGNYSLILGTADDIFLGTLTFLLGAICFKRHKIAKVIVCLIGLGIVASMASIPFAMNMVSDSIEILQDDPSYIENMIEGELRWLITLQNCLTVLAGLGLIVAVFFRVKTIKH